MSKSAVYILWLHHFSDLLYCLCSLDFALLMSSLHRKIIHSSIFCCLYGSELRGSCLSRDAPTSPLQPPPPALPGGQSGIPKPAERYNLSIMSWVCPEAQNTSPGRCPRGILIRCPNHLSWLLLTLPSLRESPGTLQGKPISTACMRDLALSVTTHSS